MTVATYIDMRVAIEMSCAQFGQRSAVRERVPRWAVAASPGRGQQAATLGRGRMSMSFACIGFSQWVQRKSTRPICPQAWWR